MKINLYWDNSNIFIGAKHAAFKKNEGYHQTTLRIQFDNLYALARGGREVRSAVCVGSVPPELQHVWERIRGLGVNVELYERGGESATEQGVDQCLQVHMLRAALDREPPALPCFSWAMAAATKLALASSPTSSACTPVAGASRCYRGTGRAR